MYPVKSPLSAPPRLPKVLREKAKQKKVQPLVIPRDGGGRFDHLVRHVGGPAALALVEAYGGRSVYVPDRVPDYHPLCRLLGKPGADALCRHFGPGWLEVPHAKGQPKVPNDVKLARLLRKGTSIDEAAIALRISPKHAKRLRAKLKADGRL